MDVCHDRFQNRRHDQGSADRCKVRPFRRADLKVSDMQCDENGNPTVKTDLLPMYTGDSARAPYELATAEKVAADTNITTRKARTKTAQRTP